MDKDFVVQMEEILGDETHEFLTTLETPSPISIRLNPLKKHSFNLPLGSSSVPWCSNGLYLEERPSFTLDPLFHAGCYYVQEASSMVIEEIAKKLNVGKKGLSILDLCAAPGGKSTLLASIIQEDSFLVCNEPIRKRANILKENLEKWGSLNYIVTNQDPEELMDLEGFFDLVLVDAPCSGEGLFRKDANSRLEWSKEHVEFCSSRQKRILSIASLLVKKDGFLIYSTCTYNDKENDQNVHWITKQSFLKLVDVDLNFSGVENTKYGFQFFPHRIRGEGFYVSVLQKSEGHKAEPGGKMKLNKVPSSKKDLLAPYIEGIESFNFYQKENGTILLQPKSLENHFAFVSRALSRRSLGLEIGIFKGNDFIPSQALAQSQALNKMVFRVELSKEEALKYLKKEDFTCPLIPSKGWFVVTYEQLPLGWAKVAGNRINNYLPTERRIRMDLHSTLSE